jgi:hypothetical protein
VPVNAENMFLLFKERSAFKFKKEYPSEQWQIISFRLIPLKTPVSFHWTVPLMAYNLHKLTHDFFLGQVSLFPATIFCTRHCMRLLKTAVTKMKINRSRIPPEPELVMNHNFLEIL